MSESSNNPESAPTTTLPVARPVGGIAAAALDGIAGTATTGIVNPAAEADYWRHNYASRPYAKTPLDFEEFAPAYRYGWESFVTHGDLNKSFESIESELGSDWDHSKGGSRLAWNQAKDASRDAWDRVRSNVRAMNKHAAV
ncbi:MAG: hypothetical protein ACOYN0_06220 [Phycisphaerales bacterium]